MDINISLRNYSHETFINELKRASDTNFFKVLCYFLNKGSFKEINELLAIFKQNDYIIDELGEIYKLTINFIDEFNNLKKSYYYMYVDYEINLILIYTLEKTDIIDLTIDKLLNNISGIYIMPITFSAFKNLTNKLRNEYDNIRCTYFTAIHYPSFYTKGKYRSDIKRSIQYYGQDGFDTLEELKEYYGLLPRTIRYDIKENGVFEINNKGKFTLRIKYEPNSAWNVFFEIINNVIEDILINKKIIDKSSYKIIPFETKTRSFDLPSSTPWILNFSHKLDDRYLTIIKNELTDNSFTIFNELESYQDSFVLSSLVYDELKHNIFSLHIDNEKAIVIPYEKNINDTFLKLYELLSDFDPESQLEGIDIE